MSKLSAEEQKPSGLVEFATRLEKAKREGVYAHDLGRYVAWDQATSAQKLDNIVWAGLTASLNRTTVPGSRVLDVVEREIDYGALPDWQRDMLLDVRARHDAGILETPESNKGMDRTWSALEAVVSAEKFDRDLDHYKRQGLYAGPGKTTPWVEVSEAKKVSAIIGLARHSGVRVPGARVLEAIEREVEYGKLPPWRREALEEVRTRLNAGELEGMPRWDSRDLANYELRVAEFLCRVEDMKQFGDVDDFGVPRRWDQFSEVQKLDRIVREPISLGIYFEPREYELIDREVDLSRVPEGRRRGIENAREMTRIGPEEYEHRRQAKYAPPNDASAQFRERIEEKLWKTCYSDGQSIWADWSDLLPEAKLELLAREMDWERVPESYFRLMVEREMDVSQLLMPLQKALQDPKANRDAFRLPDVEANNEPDPFDSVRPVTRNLVESVYLDVFPNHTAITDFGITTQQHYEAIYYPLMNEEISAAQLDAVCGNGPKLTELVNAAPSNPHKGIAFQTPWDELRIDGAQGKLTLKDILEGKAEVGTSEPRQDKNRDRSQEM